MSKLKFIAAGEVEREVEIEAELDKTLFDLGWKLDVELQSACVGKGTCGLCRVIVEEGESALTAYSEVEEKHLGNVYHITKMRLSCQATIIDDLQDILVRVRPKKKRREK